MPLEKSSTMKKEVPSRLGRGLSALIPPSSRPSAGGAEPAPRETPTSTSTPPILEMPTGERVQELPIAAIIPNTFQPRTQFNDDALEDLAASVAAHGVLQPIMVRTSGKNRYELVAGERRFRAAERAGLTRIPAIVRDITDEESLTVALIENIQREDLNAIEAARGYQQLLTQFRLTQTDLARQLGKGLSTISNSLRLLDLPSEVQESISQGQISSEHGKVLLSVAGQEQQLSLWRQVIDGQLSVKALYTLLEQQGLSTPPKRRAAAPGKDVHWQALEDQFRTALGMKIELKPGRTGRGTLMIEFSTDDEIEDLLEKLNAL